MGYGVSQQQASRRGSCLRKAVNVLIEERGLNSPILVGLCDPEKCILNSWICLIVTQGDPQIEGQRPGGLLALLGRCGILIIYPTFNPFHIDAGCPKDPIRLFDGSIQGGLRNRGQIVDTNANSWARCSLPNRCGASESIVA